MEHIAFTQVIIAAAAGVTFGNLLPFPKAWWEKATMGAGASLIASVGWVIYRAL